MPVSVPVGVGFLQWNWNCDFLARLVQSKKRIDDTTPFPMSKVLLVDRVVSIGKLERVGNSAYPKAPGTVLAIKEISWDVVAADGVVKISNFSDEFGHSISAQTIANQSNITEGDQLPIMTPEQADRFTKKYAHAMSAEPYWKEKLENFERAQISFVRINEPRPPAWTATAYQPSKDFSAIEVLTAWLIYIARDTQMSRIQIGWDATEKWHKNNLVSTRFIFARTVPFATTIDLNDTFSGVVTSVKRDYNELVNHLPCLSDILHRDAVSFSSNHKQQWPMAVSLVNSLNESEHFIMDASEIASHALGSLLTLQINSKSGAFRWIYDQNKISEEEIGRISSRLLALLQSAYTEDKANEPVAKLNLLPKAERDLLLYTWNRTTVAYPTDCCLHQLFEEQVKRDGQAIAVECNGEVLSYSELNARANRMAHYLIARGVKPDDRIALCVERTTTMIVAILGILKAGGAYVPLDPVYSSQRLTNILTDADPVFLLTDNNQKAADSHQIPVVDLNKPLPDDFPIDNPDTTENGLTPANLAYIIYTSGSTGTPKGVMIEHRDAAQLFMSVCEQLDFNERDKWCLFHSISFDMSVWEIFGALSNGSTLSIAPHDIARSTDEIYDWICTHDITVVTQTPSVFKLLMRSRTSLKSNNLRYVIFGGEALDPSIVTDWNEKFNGSQTVLVNMYGPTETAMIATSWICEREIAEDSLAPIGRPLPNKRAYLLDTNGEPVPLGVEGELYIGGAGVARGYLNRPELSAERFLPDPFSTKPEARMYRTGDRARYLPDGNLVYLGRTDDQVKIRGFRIEIGEIESQLVAHPQVREAAVQPHGHGSDTRLVAYVMTDGDSSIAQDLRNYLSNLLPDYMVPAAYVCLSSFPLTPNGKLDRRSLPVPSDEAFARQQYEAPQGGIEEKLADIWSELLGIERISRHDNFFELGGHSLHVMQFSSKAKLSNIHINARGLFSYPILKDLAEQISNCSNRLYVEFAVPIRRFGDLRPMFILPAGDGELKWAFELAHDIDKRFPVYALPWLSPDKEQSSSIEEMAKAMIPHMKKVQSHGPYSILSYCTGGILAYEVAKQLTDNGDAVSFLGLMESYPPDASAPNESEILSDSELFSIFLIRKFIEFETFNDLQWWLRVSKLPLSEAIEEVKKTNINSKAMDVEWDALLSKQCFHFQSMCKAYKIPSLPIKVHLFQALEFMQSQSEFLNLLISRKLLSDNRKRYDEHSILGWENYHLTTDFRVVPVNGDHLSITADPNNRILLAQQISRCLLENECSIFSV